uniref:Alpha-galactosidase NEW3 domain-containing protein n=1 Tax=uncultured marine group II/III euryarchaeote AD1000_53_H05 TaxID=1457782 RepID=A0A075FSY1_9EURY|nr:hypothetical protein [uncultured marine group II/III euryarchaeote AD1000_53_H05]
MISNRRQALPFFVVLLMVVSVFAFTPASAASSIVATLDADYGAYSFASVNGSAEYTVTITNDGDVDFEEVEISASFMDDTWLSTNVTFSASGDESPGSLLLGPLVSSAVIQVQVSATVGNGAKIDFAEVPMEINIDAHDDGGEDTSMGLEAIVCVTNWKAYESNYPNQPIINTFNRGDSYDYQIVVENIAVTKNPDNTTAPMPIRDHINVQYSGISGWTVTSDDETWHPFYGGTLEGMDASASHTWNVAIELMGDVKAGDHVVNFQATSTDPDDPMGGMPYTQPYGMTAIPVSAAEWYGVSVLGAGSRNVDLSEGSAISTWNVAVNNLGNAKDTFSIVWDTSGVPADWTLSAQPDTSGELDWQASSSFDMSLTVPADALAGTSASFSMTATSSNSDDETASQSFTATVDQHYGVSLSVDSDSKSKAPGGVVDFIFNVTNTGNGEDTFGIMVDGPALWTPTASQANITISAVSSSQFTISVTIPEDKGAGDKKDFIVTVTSSDGESTTNHSVSVSTSQVYGISMDYVSGSDGTATIIQGVAYSLSLNVTNNGNGVDMITLTMENQPPWAALGSDSFQIGPGQTIPIVINLSPSTSDVSGRDYIFQIVATSADGSETTSPDLIAQIEVKETEGEEVVTEELDEEDEDGRLPGFSMVVSLLALTIVVLSRRKD